MMWDYTKEAYELQQKTDPLWRMERLVLYGLGREKLNPKMLKQYLPQLRVPEDRKFFLELLLWNRIF